MSEEKRQAWYGGWAVLSRGKPAMRIVARRGELELRVHRGVDVADPAAVCVIYNSKGRTTSKEMSVQQVLQWGHWELKE